MKFLDTSSNLDLDQNGLDRRYRVAKTDLAA